MAKITIAGDAMVITSDAKLEDIKLIQKFMPKALTLKEFDENGKSVDTFKVGATDGEGSINEYGVSFGRESRDRQGLAIITIGIPDEIEDAVAFAADVVGVPLMKLNQLEETFGVVLEQIKKDRDAILENITVA